MQEITFQRFAIRKDFCRQNYTRLHSPQKSDEILNLKSVTLQMMSLNYSNQSQALMHYI